MTSRFVMYIVGAVAVTAAWIFLLYVPGQQSHAKTIAASREARATLDDYRTTISSFESTMKSSAELDSARQ